MVAILAQCMNIIGGEYFSFPLKFSLFFFQSYLENNLQIHLVVFPVDVW